MNEARCLAYNPFDGGKGDSDERILSDRMATARKSGPCCICLGEIRPGERIRRQNAIVDGQMASCRMCQSCCEAMALSWVDAGKAIEVRTALGMKRAGTLPAERA